ncbi:uncharacterized protein LOC127080693 [Lathyrus oleraceus]|uniref:uncharacterized protein LOC127080693 n=1 Tax=Pisum sativum TaxID=3888 RepID=UPI0021D29314|nr:uncharacterized protein LOC127080693 [Pisum sativum]
MPPSEVPVENVDTIMVDTSILNPIPEPVVRASPSTGISPAAALEKAHASTEPTQPIVDYTPTSSVSSPARPFQSVDIAASLPLQDPLGPVGVDTNKQQPSQITPPSTVSPSPQVTPPSAASPSTFPGLAFKPSALEAIARLRNLMKSRDASSGSEQIHSSKMGPEATKTKALVDKIRVHALNLDLPFVLMHEPAVGPEILSVLAQLKGL